MPHLKKVMPDYESKPVSFISINTRNPYGQVKSEIKKYKITFPVHFGKGTGINKDFKVKKLPRLILIKQDGTVYRDALFMKEDELRIEIDKLLAESVAVQDTTITEEEKIEGHSSE